MKLAIMQPYFFPYLSYFQLINAVDKCVLYDDFNYIKQGWVNRNRMLLGNADIIYLTVPVKHVRLNTRIRDVIIDNRQDWRKKMCKTLEFSYKSARYYNEVYPFIRSLIEFETAYLSELNKNAIIQICRYVGVNTEIVTNLGNFNEIEKKLSGVNPAGKTIKKPERMSSRVFEACRLVGADTYYNPIGGTILYSKEVFEKNGIELKFIRTKPYAYKQFKNDFVPYLSIIDTMMFNDIKTIGHLLKNYEMI